MALPAVSPGEATIDALPGDSHTVDVAEVVQSPGAADAGPARAIAPAAAHAAKMGAAVMNLKDMGSPRDMRDTRVGRGAGDDRCECNLLCGAEALGWCFNC